LQVHPDRRGGGWGVGGHGFSHCSSGRHHLVVDVSGVGEGFGQRRPLGVGVGFALHAGHIHLAAGEQRL
jgi:hypothetical protein